MTRVSSGDSNRRRITSICGRPIGPPLPNGYGHRTPALSGGSTSTDPRMSTEPVGRSLHGVRPWFVLISQGASQLDGIGTLLQPHDHPVLQCPHVCETCGELPAALAGTSRMGAQGDAQVARLKELGAVRDEFVKVCEEATKKITQHTVKAHVNGTVRKSFNDLPANIIGQHLANHVRIAAGL